MNDKNTLDLNTIKTMTNNKGSTYLKEFVRCENCSFLSFGYTDQLDVSQGGSTENKKVFNCRRNAPQVFYGSGSGWSGQMFPIIGDPSSFWCGDFQIE